MFILSQPQTLSHCFKLLPVLMCVLHLHVGETYFMRREFICILKTVGLYKHWNMKKVCFSLQPRGMKHETFPASPIYLNHRGSLEKVNTYCTSSQSQVSTAAVLLKGNHGDGKQSSQKSSSPRLLIKALMNK